MRDTLPWAHPDFNETQKDFAGMQSKQRRRHFFGWYS
jgi:hypothetical protein